MTMTTEQLASQVNRYLETNRLNEAYDCIQQLLSRPEADGRTHEVAGLVAISLNRRQEAETHLFNAVRQMPDDYNINYNLALLQVSQGRHDDAVARLQHLSKLQPANAELHNDIAVIEMSRNHLNEAMASFETALNLNPNYTQALENVAAAATEHGRVTDAHKLFEAVRTNHATTGKTRELMTSLEQHFSGTTVANQTM